MNKDKYVLAIDHGTSGIKAAIVSMRGNIIDFEFRPTPIFYTSGGGAEQNPDDWWNAIIESSGALVSKNTVPVDEIEAICCSSTFSSTVVVDASGKAMMNSLTWLDSRGAHCVKEKMHGLINVNGYSLSKALKWVTIAGGAPAISGKDDMGHMLYVREHMPEIYRNSHKFLGSKDYLNLRLSGRIAASYDSVSLFWVTNNRDINNIRYSPALLSALGLNESKFPPLMPSTEILGNILPEVADRIGLSRNTKVINGSPDLQSACVGSGAVDDYHGHVYVGTSSWLLCHVPFKKTDIFHVIASLPSAIPGKYFCANEQDMAGGCLDFVLKNILFDKNGLYGQEPPADIYERAEKAAASSAPGSGGVIFTPWLNGEKTPVEDHTLRGGFHNISTSSTSSHMVRSVMEGVAYNSRWVMGYVEKFTHKKMDNLNMIGGGAKSDTWCQIYADVLNRTIRKVKDPLQANARGAALIAACALGKIKFSDISSVVEIEKTFSPNPDNVITYNNIYKEFISIYKKNKDIYRRLNR